MVGYNLPGPLTARAPRHVLYVPQWLIRPCVYVCICVCVCVCVCVFLVFLKLYKLHFA